MLRVLFIPGIKGTELLLNEDNVWFPKNTRDLEYLTRPDLEPGGLIRSVSAFTYINVSVYRGILDEFAGQQFDYHSYDWRQDIFTQVKGLVAKIKTFIDRGDEIVLIGHSMGGMLAKLAILQLEKNEEHHNIKKLLTIGTPWHGAPDAYKALAYGEPGIFPKLSQAYLFLDDKRTRRLARQFPSTYQLLPSQHYFESAYGKFLFNPNKDKSYDDIKQDVSSFYRKDNLEFVEVWDRYISPVHQAMLKPLPDSVEHDCLIGHCYPTIYQLPDSALFGMRVIFKSNAIFMNGDGVVPIFSATPTHPANLYYTEGQHAELCSSQNVLDFIAWSLGNKEGPLPDGINLKTSDDLHNGFMASIKCPVTPTFLDENNRYIAGQFDPKIEEISDLSNNPKLVYFPLGDSKYLFVPQDAETNIKVKLTSHEKGIADISLQILNEEVTEITFDPLPIDTGETAIVSFPLFTADKEPSLRKTKGTEYIYTQTKKQQNSADLIEKKPTIPIIEIVAKPQKDTKKVKYQLVFSGPIDVSINNANNELIDVVYYSLNGEPPTTYKDAFSLDLPAGNHKIVAFGKDIFGRPIKSKEYEFSIDTIAPFTKPAITATPDGLEILFTTQTLGTKVDTLYRFVTVDELDSIDEDSWTNVKPGDTVTKNWGKLSLSKSEMLVLQYYSKNPFGPTEDVKNLNIRLGNIPAIMWEETNAYITPEMIWSNFLGMNPFAISDFSVTLIGKKHLAGTLSEAVADNVKGVTLDSVYLRLTVMYDEKYALFFIGPPTEVLKIGQEYKFSFELLTERSKEKIEHTNPRAVLRALRSPIPDNNIELENVDGTFKGKFIVSDSFTKYKFRLVITDQKNLNPSLREIPLTLKEENT
ncbi:alpha/beta hydrolase [Paenibacillus pinisoli]|uniref:Alpha/beta hydrolase n=1 Tax=Paenibacillus pinisoli TaxID=1276110 RepID=A0A3A6PKG3_9BACL|nr:alpha/beta hydrolase [Paenibacillus pinisoli]RJX40850.1 alpha/beta hydrolase [Paenibacillus pinisoli]